MRGNFFADAVKVSPYFFCRNVQAVFASKSFTILGGKVVQAFSKIYLRHFLKQGLLLGRLKSSDFAGEIID